MYRFTRDEVSSELFENEPPGTVVKYLEVRSTSSLMFEITSGNAEDMFEVNPSTGIVITKRSLDYETTRMYNLSVTATNMVTFDSPSHPTFGLRCPRVYYDVVRFLFVAGGCKSDVLRRSTRARSKR